MNIRRSASKVFVRALILIIVITLSAGAYPAEYDSVVAQKVVDSLSISQFKSSIKSLAGFGGRSAGSQSNAQARQWLEDTLQDLGYTNVENQATYKNVYCTKVGAVSPDSMYIVSAHFDGMLVAEAANDDGSGCALVLEGARLFANPLIKTHYSIRWILWNNEETGLQGSKAYVAERNKFQGTTEPVWLGMIQHDMILFDHGLPPQSEQIPDADIDVEYQSNSTAAAKSLALAQELVKGCEAYAPDYPAEIGSKMSNTDSDPFKNYVAAVSVRENCRLDEIGNGADPHWHTATDLYETFSEKDFLLGYNAMQMTIGTVCRLAGVYDSVPTPNNHFDGINNNQSMLSPIAKGVMIFTVQGKKIDEYHGLCNWQRYVRSIRLQRQVPQGVYIIQLITDDNAKCRFLQVER
jgi:hypothetical protein